MLMANCHEGHFNRGIFSDNVKNAKQSSVIRHLLLVAAGTGFTPMPKLLQYFVAFINEKASKLNKAIPSSVTFLCFNKTLNDIIWKELSIEISLFSLS